MLLEIRCYSIGSRFRENLRSKTDRSSRNQFYNLEYPDGSTPDVHLRDKWLNIVKEHRNGCIAVHCVHGLGRSPVLVAMALREAGMSRQECIDYVRSRRRGSFNLRQLEYLQNYPSAHRLTHKHGACALM